MTPVWVFNRNGDGGVSQNVPVAAWAAKLAEGYFRFARRGWIESRVAGDVKNGAHEDKVAPYWRALCCGGVSSREAYELMRDRDIGHLGTAIEPFRRDEIPPRWFRDAWRRSANGGPVTIDLRKAQQIQWSAVRRAVGDENRLREDSLFARAPLDPGWTAIQSAIRHARGEDELYKVWPDGLPRPIGGQPLDPRHVLQ